MGGCTTKSSGLFDDTNAGVCPTSRSVVVLESLLPRPAYNETSIHVQSRARTFGCRKVLCRCSLGQSTYSHSFVPMGAWTSVASNWETNLLHNLFLTVYRLGVWGS